MVHSPGGASDVRRPPEPPHGRDAGAVHPDREGREGAGMSAAAMARGAESATKGFGELEAEVINAGRCTDCRACVDLCAADGPSALEMDLGAFRFDADKCNDCGLCYAVCP